MGDTRSQHLVLESRDIESVTRRVGDAGDSQRNHKPAYSWGRPAYSWRTASAPGRPGPPAARGMAAIGALIACAAAATGLAPSLHLAEPGDAARRDLGSAASGVPPARRQQLP